jgi:hypothetical protein
MYYTYTVQKLCSWGWMFLWRYNHTKPGTGCSCEGTTTPNLGLDVPVRVLPHQTWDWMFLWRFNYTKPGTGCSCEGVTTPQSSIGCSCEGAATFPKWGWVGECSCEGAVTPPKRVSNVPVEGATTPPAPGYHLLIILASNLIKIMVEATCSIHQID